MIHCLLVQVKYHTFRQNDLPEQNVYTYGQRMDNKKRKKKPNCTTRKCTVFTGYGFSRRLLLQTVFVHYVLIQTCVEVKKNYEVECIVVYDTLISHTVYLGLST